MPASGRTARDGNSVSRGLVPPATRPDGAYTGSVRGSVCHFVRNFAMGCSFTIILHKQTRTRHALPRVRNHHERHGIALRPCSHRASCECCRAVCRDLFLRAYGVAARGTLQSVHCRTGSTLPAGGGSGSVCVIEYRVGLPVSHPDVVLLRRKRMPQVTCSKCHTLTPQGSFPTWAIVVSICFFPVGLLALLAGRNPAKCPSCGFTWQS